MVLARLGFIFLFLNLFAFGQLTTKSPVDELKDQVAEVLKEANVPFTPEQEKEPRVPPRRRPKFNRFG
jgi:hypothetical protein